MLAFLRVFFETYVVPHIYSVRGGSPQDTWVLVVSDFSIAGAHAAMVVVLAQVLLKRKDPLFRKVMLVFILFLGFRGVSQMLSLWTVWHLRYQLGTGIRTCSTVLSVTTAVVLVLLLPVLHRLPSSAQIQRESEERNRSEEEIREREERFRSFVESVEDYAIYRIDTQGIVETWNLGAERMKGYTAEEIVGHSFTCFYTVEDRAAGKPEEALRIAGETGRFFGDGWRVRKDGSTFFANVILRPMRDKQGVLRGFSKVTRDLTESREMESRYQRFLEAAPDAIVILKSDSTIEFINTKAEHLFGYDRSEVVGRSVDMLVPQRTREAQADYRDSLFEDVQHPQPAVPPETLGQRKDGSSFPLEFTVSPLESREGRLLLFAIRDLTDQKRTEARFRSLLEAAPDAIFITSRSGRIVYMNRRAEEIFGYTRREVLGKPSNFLIPERLRPERAEERERFFATPEQISPGYGGVYICLRKGGEEFPVEASRSPMETADGPVMLTSVRDITERQLAARKLADTVAELRQSNEALEQFAHIASHDLQEPLRMVASYIQLLARRYKGRLDADADEFIAYAVDGTRRMKRLIEDLLLYSRAGKGSPPIREFAAEVALREALSNLHTAIEESHAVVTHGELPTIAAADSELVKVFQNLVGNAIKYRSARTPAIHVSSRVEEKEWIFSVRDNGIGIDPKFHERIFLIFHRLHGREEYEGTGIGLAIVKRILQQQGGKIWVESEPGQGSAFHFALPMRELR